MLATMSGNPFVFGVLFLLLVLGIGLALVWIAERSPAAPFFQRSTGVVSAFANTLAVLFGLLTAFLANDVWMQVEKARAAVVREADATALLLTVTAGLGERGKALNDLTIEYGKLAARDDWRSAQQRAAADRQMRRMVQEAMFGGIASADQQVRRVTTDALMTVRTAHRELVSVTLSRTAHHKWVAAFILGILTQAAIVAVHLGRARAAALAVTLYTLAMAFTLWVILARLDPFAGWTPLSLQPIAAAIAPPG